ncbi:MAG: alkaline shock response membrane anchor protein AmaP [Pseudonocardia sp.]
MSNRPARLNRFLLAVLGLLLLGAGGFALAAGLGLLRGPLPGLDPAAPLVPSGTRLLSWTPWAALGIAVLVGLASLRWLVAQAMRRPATPTWRLHTDAARGTTRVAADAAATAVAADVEAYAGVHRASAVLVGARAAPHLQLDVSTEEGASVTDLRARVAEHALPRLRQALDADTLTAELLLRVDTDGASGARAR